MGAQRLHLPFVYVFCVKLTVFELARKDFERREKQFLKNLFGAV
jgi:hypothetical protein